MPSANNDSFTSSFSIFLRFFNYLIAMARTFNTILNESDKVGHPCLVSDLWGKPSVFTTEYNVNCGFDIYGLYYVEIYFFYTHFVETFFIINGSWILWYAFSTPVEKNHMMFILHFVDVGTSCWFVSVEPFFHPWNKSHLIIMHSPFNVCWIRFANILLRVFISVFIRDSGMWFSFCVMSLDLISGQC